MTLVKIKLSNLTGRLGRALAAQGYNQLATLFIQLATIPALLGAWGVERYGVWLALTAVPTYLALSDFGFTFVAKNEMLMQVARGDRARALCTYQSVFCLLLVSVGGLCLICALLAYTIPIDQVLNLGQVSVTEARATLFLQVSSVLAYQFFLLLCSGIRCEGQAARETFIATSARLAETLAVVVAAMLTTNLAVAAAIALLVRLLSSGVVAAWLTKRSPWLRLGFRAASAERLRALLRPSLSYMLVPLSNAALIQGPVIILSASATPSTVAVYSTCRTVTRLGMSGANLLNFAFTPEYSNVFARDDHIRARSIFCLHALLLLLGAASYLAIMSLLGHEGVSLLSHGAIDPPVWLLQLMILSVVVEMIWSGLFAPIAARNAHGSTACILALLSLACMCTAALAPKLWTAAAAVAATNLGMLALLVSRYVRSSSDLNFKDALRRP